LKKFEGMLFCTDLDGTLFTTDKKVSKQNLDAIEYFKSEGGYFTFITGRMPSTSQSICEIINPNAPFGCINGGGIYDRNEKRLIWAATLPTSALELVNNVYDNLCDIGIQVNTEKHIYFCRDNSAMVFFRKATGAPFITRNQNEIDEPILKVVFAHEEEAQIQALINLLNSHPKSKDFDYIRSERRLYEILPKGSSKGNLLVRLAEHLKIDMRRTIAIGDYNNDISMIKAAGLGVAVENAIEGAKKAADYISVNNNCHAIADVVDKLDHGILKL